MNFNFVLPIDFADQLVQDILIQYEHIYDFDTSDVSIKSEDGEQRKDTALPEMWASTQLVQLFTFLISIYRLVQSSDEPALFFSQLINSGCQ